MVSRLWEWQTFTLAIPAVCPFRKLLVGVSVAQAGCPEGAPCPGPLRGCVGCDFLKVLKLFTLLLALGLYTP